MAAQQARGGHRLVRQGGPDVSKFVLIGVAVALLASAAWSLVYQVEAESEALVLRFGKHVDTVGPGLHFKLPFGIDQVQHVAVLRQLKQEYGFSTPGASNRFQSSDRNEQLEERSMVTGDLNAALVEWVIQYRIDSPAEYAFNVRNPDETLRDASESVMREVVGDRTVDEVITIGRQDIENTVLEKLRELVDAYGMGISISQVQLKDVNPPDEVKASFNRVNQAQQQMKQAINVANGEYNKVVPRAKGEADQKITAAQGYASKRVNEAEGEAAAFKALLAEYLKAPEVTKRRIYLETMGEVLPKVRQKVVLDAGAGGVLPILDLNQALKGGGQ